MKKILAIICAFVLLCAGCAATPEKPTSSPTEAAQATPEAVTLFDTSTVKIVLEGAETTVTDKSSGSEYSFTTSKTYTVAPPTLEQLQARCIARTSANTDTVKIELAGALIVVTDKATGEVYYINR